MKEEEKEKNFSLKIITMLPQEKGKLNLRKS